MTTRPYRQGRPPATGACVPEIVRLWREPLRVEQLARLQDLEVQTCDEEGKAAWDQARLIQGQLPDGVRVDLPSWRVFARVLGVYRSAATLKKRPMNDLELSAEDIASVAGYGTTAVQAALRWLGCDPIKYRGLQVAYGLGYISRVRRKAKAFVQGLLKDVYRTSRTGLTFLAKGLLGLLGDEQGPVAPGRRKWRSNQSKDESSALPPVPAAEPNWDLQLAEIRALRMQV